MATMVPTSELSKGMILEINGNLHTVMDFDRMKAGKGNSEARVRIKMRDVKTGYTFEKVYRTDDRLPKAQVESRTYQYLYNDGDLFYFMDGETFEQKTLAKDVIGDAAHYLTDGLSVDMLVYNDQPISVQMPINVDLKIAETEPGFKGDTATGGGKPAVTETGLKVQVPIFVNVGDVIKVDTRTGQYISRV